MLPELAFYNIDTNQWFWQYVCTKLQLNRLSFIWPFYVLFCGFFDVLGNDKRIFHIEFCILIRHACFKSASSSEIQIMLINTNCITFFYTYKYLLNSNFSLSANRNQIKLIGIFVFSRCLAIFNEKADQLCSLVHR